MEVTAPAWSLSWCSRRTRSLSPSASTGCQRCLACPSAAPRPVQETDEHIHLGLCLCHGFTVVRKVVLIQRVEDWVTIHVQHEWSLKEPTLDVKCKTKRHLADVGIKMHKIMHKQLPPSYQTKATTTTMKVRSFKTTCCQAYSKILRHHRKEVKQASVRYLIKHLIAL